MLQDEVRQGIALIAGDAGLRSEDVDRMSTAIAAEALFDTAGRQLLARRPHGGLISFDLFKAVTAVAGVLGAVIPVVIVPVTFLTVLPAVLAALAALGSLQGLSQPLPRACVQVVTLLLEREDRKMTCGELRSRFDSVYDGPTGELQRELKRALEALERINSIRIELGTVHLVERIIIRI